MIFDEDVLDRIEEDSRDDLHDWYKPAFKALSEYVSEMGVHEFTSVDFRRWADYYCDLPTADRTAYSWLFRKARDRKIVKVSRKRQGSGFNLNEKTLWVAA